MGAFDVYAISLLKAWFGDAAAADNDYGFARMPKISGNHSQFPTCCACSTAASTACSSSARTRPSGPARGPHAPRPGKLDWLVVRDFAEIETARFWKDSPEVRSGELRSEDIGTEVFLMPCAGHVEKEGSFTNTQRLVQWHDKAVDPPGDARSDLWFMYHLVAASRPTTATRRPPGLADPQPDLGLPGHGRHDEPSAEAS